MSRSTGAVGATPASVVLLWGDDEFLLRDSARALFGDVRPAEIDAADWQGGETADLATPSLFGERRALLVTGCRRVPDDALREIGAYAAAPAPDALLVLLAEVGERGRPPAPLTKLVKEHGRVREVNLARKDVGRWVVDRAGRKGARIRSDAAAALVEHLGEAPAALD